MKLIIFFMLFITFTGQAGTVPLLRKLSLKEETKSKLRGQMMELQSNMEKIIDMISRGQWETLEKLANNMAQDKFFKSDLPPAEFPDEFKKIAAQFNESAGYMAMAAKRQQGSLVLANYNRLLSTCMKCHADFAPNLFLKQKEYSPPEELPQKYYKPPSDWRQPN